MSVTYNARELCMLSEDEVWDCLTKLDRKTKIELIFDDGKLSATPMSTILSWYFWWGQRWKPHVPLLKEHHHRDRRLTSGLLSGIVGKVAWFVYDHVDELTTDMLGMAIKVVINQISNAITDRMARYATSISAEDIVDVLAEPKIKSINDSIQAIDLDDPRGGRLETAISKAHEDIKHELVHNPTLDGNRLAEAVRASVVSANQVLQCVGPRGYTTDVNNHVFPRPILRGFGHGLRKFYDSIIESRAAALSLILNKDMLSDIEYFSRQMQMLGSSVEHLDTNYDCGTTKLVPWPVERADFEQLIGTWYATKEGEQADKFITPDDSHLIGTMIFIRTPLTCSHHNAKAICGKCYGEYRLAVPEHTNIGHFCNVVLGAKSSQKTLSNKHFQGSARIDVIHYEDEEDIYLRAYSNHYHVGLKEQSNANKLILHVSKDEAGFLKDIDGVDDIGTLVCARLTAMENVIIEEHSDDGFKFVPLQLTTRSRKGSFTHDMLRYIKKYGYTIKEESYAIDMSKWDFDIPVWVLPRRQGSMLEFVGLIEDHIKVKGTQASKKKLELTDIGNIYEALHSFYLLVNSKFEFPVNPLAVILRATMVRDPANGDFRLPVGTENATFASYGQIMANRSLSAGFAYQEQEKLLVAMSSFTNRNRTTHPFDPMFVKQTMH